MELEVRVDRHSILEEEEAVDLVVAEVMVEKMTLQQEIVGIVGVEAVEVMEVMEELVVKDGQAEEEATEVMVEKGHTMDLVEAEVMVLVLMVALLMAEEADILQVEDQIMVEVEVMDPEELKMVLTMDKADMGLVEQMLMEDLV